MPNHVSGEYVEEKPKEDPQLLKGRRLDFGEESLGGYMPYQINNDQSKPSTYNLPYMPTQNNLDYLTISLNATHSAGTPNFAANIRVHNINGHAHLMNHYNTLRTNAKTSTNKPFLFTDSSFPGSGAYGVALITDQMRTWDNLRNTIS